MALKISKKPATAVVQDQFKDKGAVISENTAHETVHEVPIKQTVPAAQLCEVCVDLSFTKNLGNYQSAKVGVSIKIPCDYTEVDKAFDYAKEWSDNRLNQLVAELDANDGE